ncbi:MAG: chemotaxis protein CheW [Mariprofundus sp.]|nr:chemotaxis protein CheW [Mariprofundus sp.]
MKYLAFKVGQDRYALKLHKLKDVVPAVALKEIPKSPAWFSGLLHFQQSLVPVIDLCQLAMGKPAKANLGRRIALLPWSDDKLGEGNVLPAKAESGQAQKLLGIMAEMMTQMIDERELSKAPRDVPIRQSPWLGEIASYQNELVQLIEPEALMTDEVRALMSWNDK